VRAALATTGEPALWFGILPAAGGVFGVATGVVVIVVASLLRPSRSGPATLGVGNP
jgi:hypothetical protein